MSALSGLFIPTGERPCCGPCHILRALMQIPSFSGFLHCANEGKISPRSFDTSFAVTQVFRERRYFAFRRRPQKFSSPTPGQGICANSSTCWSASSLLQKQKHFRSTRNGSRGKQVPLPNHSCPRRANSSKRHCLKCSQSFQGGSRKPAARYGWKHPITKWIWRRWLDLETERITHQ